MTTKGNGHKFCGMGRKQDSVIAKIVSLLKREYKPSRLYLFGSQVSGGAQKDSDYDFVMVLPSFSGDRMALWEECRELVRSELGVSVDVFAYSEEDFKELSDDFSSIPETALNTGRELLLGAE